MKNKEIVQALRCCAEGDCKGCAMHEDKQRCQENLLDKAAEAIELLTAENAALREKQRWILVTERLPEKQQRVIVRCKTVGTTVGWIMFGEWVTDLGPGCGEVTHWMPLPGAPEGDKA